MGSVGSLREKDRSGGEGAPVMGCEKQLAGQCGDPPASLLQAAAAQQILCDSWGLKESDMTERLN